MQSFEVHMAYNFLMDYYQNDEIVHHQKQMLEKTLRDDEKIIRDKFLRFCVMGTDVPIFALFVIKL